MRRNRGILTNAILFTLALFIILYINLSPTSSDPLFEWSKVRYKTALQVSPPSRGLCPGISRTLRTPVLVVARTRLESSSWLDALSSLFHICTYTADVPRDETSVYLQTPANKGHEAMAYLTFIIDNYDALPASGIVFVHGSRFAWHNDDPAYDNLRILTQLNVSRALWGSSGKSLGYSNLRCDWAAGMCDANDPDSRPQGSLEVRIRANLERANLRIQSDLALVEALVQIFGEDDEDVGHNDHRQPVVKTNTQRKRLRTALGRTQAIRAQCCAQFVVARENIWGHTREEYIALRQWLLDSGPDSASRYSQSANNFENQDTETSDRLGHQLKIQRQSASFPEVVIDDVIAGRVISYIWHILFLASNRGGTAVGETPNSADNIFDAGTTVNLDHLNALACPRADECYCRLYGRCDLPNCESPGRCDGQYVLPPDYSLPKDWAERHI